MICVSGLQVNYDTVVAVRDVDLAVHPGEIVGLVGPNGAGKTSLIKAATGLIETIQGTVTLGGVDMSIEPEQGWRRMGYMPDFAPVYEDLRVWEYLQVFAVAYAIPYHERMTRIRHGVERMQLESKWDAFISELSRGMRQRLVLAKTLLHNPDILLLDEPASGMDPLARVEMRNILKEKAREGATILISSHILSEMDDLCTSLAVMERGRMLVSGTLDEIRAKMQTKNALKIRTLPPIDAALAVLEATQEIQNLRPEQVAGCYKADFTGDDEAAAAVLARLHEAGARVASFSLEADDMESLFLKIGGKEVS